jgi:hypothetical protein
MAVSVFTAVEQQIKNTDTMGEVAPKLRIYMVSGVIEPSQRDTTLGEYLLFDVILCCRTGNVFITPC